VHLFEEKKCTTRENPCYAYKPRSENTVAESVFCEMTAAQHDRTGMEATSRGRVGWNGSLAWCKFCPSCAGRYQFSDVVRFFTGPDERRDNSVGPAASIAN